MPNQLTRNIKSEMILAGVTQAMIARSLEVSIVSINDVVHFRRSTPRIRDAIAQAVGKPVPDLFPESKPQEEVAA